MARLITVYCVQCTDVLELAAANPVTKVTAWSELTRGKKPMPPQ